MIESTNEMLFLQGRIWSLEFSHTGSSELVEETFSSQRQIGLRLAALASDWREVPHMAAEVSTHPPSVLLREARVCDGVRDDTQILCGESNAIGEASSALSKNDSIPSRLGKPRKVICHFFFTEQNCTFT